MQKPNLTLTPEQSHIVAQALATPFLDEDYSDITVIKGYAGTGKTVTTAQIIRELREAGMETIVLAPTAAALSVIESRLADVEGVHIKTCASVTSSPVKRLSLGEDLPQFNLNPDGLCNLGRLLKSLKVDDTGFVSAIEKGTFYRRRVNLESPGEALRGAQSVVVDTPALASALRSTIVGSKIGHIDTEMTQVHDSPSESAAKLQRLVNKSGRGYHNKIVILVDEASMVDETTMDIIMLAAHALNAKLVICGDPGQLQPVGGAQSDLMSNPTTGRWEHVVKMSADSSCSLSITTHELTDVLRSDDKIAHLAKKIREGVPLSVLSNNYDDVIETDKSSPEDILLENREVFAQADAVVTFRNKSVAAYNRYLREMAGRSGDMCEGDRLVCTQNTYGEHIYEFRNSELLTVKAIGVKEHSALTNSAAVLEQRAADTASEFAKIKVLLDAGSIMPAVVTKQSGEERGVFVWNPQASLPRSTKSSYTDVWNGFDNPPLAPLVDVQYAYALTVHKSQGSEWNNVVYVTSASDRSIMTGTNMPYTAITRAKQNATVIYSA